MKARPYSICLAVKSFIKTDRHMATLNRSFLGLLFLMIIRAAKYLPVGSFLPSFHVQKRESYQRDVENFLLWICDQTLEV